MKKIAKSSSPETTIDTRHLETLVGYNSRRAVLKAIGLFS